MAWTAIWRSGRWPPIANPCCCRRSRHCPPAKLALSSAHGFERFQFAGRSGDGLGRGPAPLRRGSGRHRPRQEAKATARRRLGSSRCGRSSGAPTARKSLPRSCRSRALVPEDGWCDAPGDPNYNKLVKHPYPVSAEHLWLDSHVYDIIAVVGFNDDPVVPGAGSAIFLHLARDGYPPTAGCVALTDHDLRAALAQFTASGPGQDHGLDFMHRLSVARSTEDRLVERCASTPVAEDRAANPHIGRAETHRHLEIPAHAHAEFGKAVLARQLGEKGEMRRDIVFDRAECTSGRSAATPACGHSRSGLRHRRGSTPAFCGSSPVFTCTNRRGHLPCLSRSAARASASLARSRV